MPLCPTEDVDPRSLRFLPANPWLHPEAQLDAVAASLAAHDWAAPLVANRRNQTVLDGNGRLAVALREARPTVPVRWVDFTEEQEQRFVATINQTARTVELDEGRMAELLQELARTPAGLPAGWDQAGLDALLASLGQSAEPEGGLLPGADPDALPETVETRCQPGDLWELGAHRLLCGDSTKREDVERLMDGKRASLMATDPPYGVNFLGGDDPERWQQDKVRKRGGGDAVERWNDAGWVENQGTEWFEAFLTAARDGAWAQRVAVYQWHADRMWPKVAPIWDSIGLLAHQVIIWRKSRPTLGWCHFQWQHEPCAYGWMRGAEPERQPPGGSVTVWDVDCIATAQMTHPTQKPVELFTRPIEWHTAPSEIVYEPFAGSGTQIIAAEQLARACYALEISPEFCDVILSRYEQATGQTAHLHSRSA